MVSSLKAFNKLCPHSILNMMNARLSLADLMITLKTGGKPQSIFCLLYVFAFMGSFVIFVTECVK